MPSITRSFTKVSSKLKSIRDNHRERHRPSGFEFAFADRIDFLNSDAWDAVTANQSLFLRRSVLRVVEDHGPENLSPRYSLVFRDSTPVAALVVQRVQVRGQHLTSDNAPSPSPKKSSLLKHALAPAKKLAAATVNQRLLVAGNLMSWGFHGIGLNPNEDPVELWPAIADALYRIRRAERLAGQTDLLMVKDITPSQGGVEALERFSYSPLETEPNMVLSLQPGWKTYDDYLAALDAKYRRNSKDQLKKLAQAGCTLEILKDPSADAKRLHELYLNVHRNASVRLVTLPEGYLPGLARALGDDFSCTVIRRGETILGFVTVLKDRDTAIGYYIGFDREAAGEGLPIYLRLLHSTIPTALGWGCRSLSLGRTALEPKAALGARPEPLSVWIRHRVPAMNWVVGALLGSVPHEEAPQRSPFKATAPPANGE